MDFRVLGPLEVSDGGRAVALGGVKQRSLLAILLQHPNAIVSTDHLLAELWGDAPPASADNSIHVYVSRLRKELGPDRLITRPPGYALRVDASELDLAKFKRLRDEGRPHEALALWRGPAYDDLAYEPCVQAERARLDELRLVTLEERIDADLANGRHADLVGELEAVIAEHPLRERLRGQLMLALYRSARQAEALQAYRMARRELASELGLEPGGELRRLERAILQQDPALDPPAEAPAAGSLLVVPSSIERLDDLLALATSLAAPLVLACVVPANEVGAATSALAARARELPEARAAAFSSPEPGADLARLAEREGCELILLQGAPLEGAARVVIETARCDVGVLTSAPRDGPVLVPFGAGRHDWAALELGARVALRDRSAAAPDRRRHRPARTRRQPVAGRRLADRPTPQRRGRGAGARPPRAARRRRAGAGRRPAGGRLPGPLARGRARPRARRARRRPSRADRVRAARSGGGRAGDDALHVVADRVGAVIGYELEELIGHGGMGVVYRATDVKLQRPVALKLIVPELAEDARFRKRFLDESRLAASLDHASVVPIYEAGEQDGQLFLAMRYVEGSDLRTLLRRDGPLALERTLALLGQIASALDAAHRSGLVHRDVKPANILVDDDDHAYLTDFGVSKQLGGVTTDTGRLVGSLDYLAPEQIAGERVDSRSDQYALACVLYECLTGTPAFRRESEAETLWAHMQGRYAPVAGLERVFKRAFARDPKDRYGSCGELIEAARVRRPVRHRARWIGAALAALAAAAATALYLSDGDVEALPPGSFVVALDADGGIGSFTEAATAPSNIAVGEGAVWVLDSEAETVARLDPATQAVKRFSAGPRPTDLAVGGGAVWVGNGAGSESFGVRVTTSISRVDPESLKVTGTVELSRKPSAYGPAPSEGFPRMAVGAGARVGGRRRQPHLPHRSAERADRGEDPRRDAGEHARRGRRGRLVSQLDGSQRDADRPGHEPRRRADPDQDRRRVRHRRRRRRGLGHVAR